MTTRRKMCQIKGISEAKMEKIKVKVVVSGQMNMIFPPHSDLIILMQLHVKILSYFLVVYLDLI